MHRERLEDVVAVALGLFFLVVAWLQLVTPPWPYAPDDVRSQDWYYPVVSGITAGLGLFALAVGVIRLLRR